MMAQLNYPDPDHIPEPLAGMLAAMPHVGAIDMLAHSPVLTEHFLRLAQAQFTALELPDRARELIILTVAARGRCEFEYQQHIPISAAAGVEPTLRQAIWDRTLDPASLPHAESELIGFVTNVLNRPRVSTRRLAALQRFYPPRQIVEILQLIGFYWGFGRICTVLDIEVQNSTTLDAFEAVANLSAG
jgi:alkylhydroperoxidase family enzyme